GLRRIPVIAPALHDTDSAVAAILALNPQPSTPSSQPPSWTYISSGTWSLMGVELPKAELSSHVLKFNLTNEGGVDGTYRLLKNIAGLWLVHQCKRAFERHGRKMEYPELVRLAKAAPPLRSLVDPDDPRFLNPPD